MCEERKNEGERDHIKEGRSKCRKKVNRGFLQSEVILHLNKDRATRAVVI